MRHLTDITDIMSSYSSENDIALIKKAYVFAAKVHEGQKRRSGEPYLTHPLEVAYILAEMKLDPITIIAGLLHDTVEDTAATLEEVERLFGKEVRELVDGVTKLGQIRFRSSQLEQAENFRKMIMAMAKDIRVIVIKIADRLHNMRTMEFMPEQKQTRIASETLDIYSPIANRLGMQRLKDELEDLSLKYLKPDVYHAVAANINRVSQERKGYVDKTKKIIIEEMGKHGIDCKIYGRSKHIYSIHRKMERQNIPFHEVYDLIAFRIVVDTLAHCYETLGIIHSLWKPIPGRFKDYIAMPKQNHYQSLHTTVIGPDGERVEVQIRTREMNEIAEKGIAAHWKYKEGGRVESKDEEKFKWVRQLLQWQRELDEPVEFLDTVKLDLFEDAIYAFTPAGKLIELTRGATPVDFAYAVHTDVGHNCNGAKVNGKIVPLRYEIKSGDSVEILTQKGGHPNKDWLEFVKTSRAKAKIRQYVRSEQRVNGMALGRELLEKEAERLKFNLNKLMKGQSVKEFSESRGYLDIDMIFVDIGYGKLTTRAFLQKVAPELNIASEEPEQPKKRSRIRSLFKKDKKDRGLVKIDGISNMMVSYGKCCNPVPGDDVVGYVTLGRGISIHISDCAHILASDPARCVPVEWNISSGMTRTAKLKVICVNRPGLLTNMTEAITSTGVNISGANSMTKDNQSAINVFDVEIKDTSQLRNVILSLEQVKGVISVERIRG